MFKKILNYIGDVALDKWAHLGIGGLICALFTFPLMLQEGNVVGWDTLLFPLGGTVAVLMGSLFKETVDSKWDTMDLVFAMIGCALVYFSIFCGIIFYKLS